MFHKVPHTVYKEFRNCLNRTIKTAKYNYCEGIISLNETIQKNYGSLGLAISSETKTKKFQKV